MALSMATDAATSFALAVVWASGLVEEIVMADLTHERRHLTSMSLTTINQTLVRLKLVSSVFFSVMAASALIALFGVLVGDPRLQYHHVAFGIVKLVCSFIISEVLVQACWAHSVYTSVMISMYLGAVWNLFTAVFTYIQVRTESQRVTEEVNGTREPEIRPLTNCYTRCCGTRREVSSCQDVVDTSLPPCCHSPSSRDESPDLPPVHPARQTSRQSPKRPNEVRIQVETHPEIGQRYDSSQEEITITPDEADISSQVEMTISQNSSQVPEDEEPLLHS